MPPEHPRQMRVLFPERTVQILSTPFRHGSQRSGITVFGRYLPDHVLAVPRHVFRDIDVHHPAQPLLHEPVAQGAESITGRLPRSEAVRARLEVRLVDRFQQQQDRPLRHLVFELRDAQQSFRSLRLGM